MLGLPRALGRVRAAPLGARPARGSVAAVASIRSVGAAPRRVAPLSSLPKTFDVEGRARALGVPLSPEECDEVRGDVKRATPAHCAPMTANKAVDPKSRTSSSRWPGVRAPVLTM